MPLDVDASDSLDRVREKLQWEKLIPLSHQKLIFDGIVLEGSRPISEYNLRHYSKLELAIKRPGDKSTQVGCDYCEQGEYICAYALEPRWMIWLCETCAANKALAGEFDLLDYGISGPPENKKSHSLSELASVASAFSFSGLHLGIPVRLLRVWLRPPQLQTSNSHVLRVWLRPPQPPTRNNLSKGQPNLSVNIRQSSLVIIRSSSASASSSVYAESRSHDPLNFRSPRDCVFWPRLSSNVYTANGRSTAAGACHVSATRRLCCTHDVFCADAWSAGSSYVCYTGSADPPVAGSSRCTSSS